MSVTTHPNGRIPSPGPAPDTKAPDGGRDAHGRFAKGNVSGTGNPFARRVAALRTAFVTAITEEDLEAIARALARQAQEGNTTAAKLLLAYGLGRPAATVDPDTLDLQEWELYRRLPDPGPELLAATQRLSLEVALDYLRTVVPGMAEAQRGMVLDQVQEMKAREQAEADARARRAARRQEKRAQQAATAPAAEAPAAPPLDAEALARLVQLLGEADLTETTGPATPCQEATPPSPNGVRRPGSPRG
jgi:hypothetical protein